MIIGLGGIAGVRASADADAGVEQRAIGEVLAGAPSESLARYPRHRPYVCGVLER